MLSVNNSTVLLEELKPYLQEISISLLEETELAKKKMKWLLYVLESTPLEFFEMNRRYIFPYLFLNRKVELMDDIAQGMKKDLTNILIEDSGFILGHILMEASNNIEQYFLLFVKLAHLDPAQITIGQLFKSSLMFLIETLSLGLGSDRADERSQVILFLEIDDRPSIALYS